MNGIGKLQISRVCTGRDTDFTGFAQIFTGLVCTGSGFHKKAPDRIGIANISTASVWTGTVFQNSTGSRDYPVSRGIPRDVHNGKNPEESPDIFGPSSLSCVFENIQYIPGQPLKPVETRTLAVKFDLKKCFRDTYIIWSIYDQINRTINTYQNIKASDLTWGWFVTIPHHLTADTKGSMHRVQKL